jgi:UDP-2-acetamido-3-amino-2,3-dideoxy-glucuronate N-acetyltransferase
MVGHLMRYHPAFEALAGLVGAGRLGRLRYVYSHRLDLGRFRRDESVLWSFAPHDISMILALVGSVPHEVRATGAAYLREGIADVTTTHLGFPGGEQAHVFVSWLNPVKEQRLVVVGDTGMAVFDDGRDWSTKLVLFEHRVHWQHGQASAGRAEGCPVALQEAEPLRIEVEHFLECMVSRNAPITDGHEATDVLAVLDRAHRAMEVGSRAR